MWSSTTTPIAPNRLDWRAGARRETDEGGVPHHPVDALDGDVTDQALVDRLVAHRTIGGAPRAQLEWLVGHGELRDEAAGQPVAVEGRARNNVPYQWVDVDRDPAMHELASQLSPGLVELPVVLCSDGVHLVNPTMAALAERVGLKTRATCRSTTWWSSVVDQAG